MSLQVTYKFRIFLKIGLTSVEPSWKHWLFTSNYRCLHTEVPYNTVHGWNRLNVKAQCSLFTYNWLFLLTTSARSYPTSTRPFTTSTCKPLRSLSHLDPYMIHTRYLLDQRNQLDLNSISIRPHRSSLIGDVSWSLRPLPGRFSIRDRVDSEA